MSERVAVTDVHVGYEIPLRPPYAASLGSRPGDRESMSKKIKVEETWLGDRKVEKDKDQELVDRLRAGGTLTKKELAYCTLNWSPIKQSVNIYRFAKSRKTT